MWGQMKKGVSNDILRSFASKSNSTPKRTAKKGAFITEVRDFAGQDIEVKKLLDSDLKEAMERAKIAAPSPVDAVLEQIKKKQKLSVLDKTKMDWGEFKEENNWKGSLMLTRGVQTSI
ncbi:hypothetical protein HN51_031406 [Arachis hypogaea]